MAESANNLQSKAFAQVLDLVCEGEIGGLVDGAKSVFLNETRLQNPDGTYNFKSVVFETRNGTQDQSYIQGFSSAQNETNVATEVKASTPIVKTINDLVVDAVRVRISLPQLTYQDPNNGDLLAAEVTYAIDVQSNGGGFTEVVRETIIGKTVSKFEKSYYLTLTGSPPWDIRVRRITADAELINLQNRTVWESYAEIIEAKLKYPNSALVAISLDSAQFQSIPTRAYDMKLLKIKVPSNYNPDTKTYTGIWDGTFHAEKKWTDNPAWIFYDIVTNNRYGLGGFIPETQVDKWSLYTIGKYCDEKVINGRGGFESRFSCNVYFQTRQEAYKVLQDLASCFRSMIYWSEGSIISVQDSPRDPVHLFTQANVVDGIFSYSGSSSKTRHTVALVSWNDPDDFYKQKVEYVEDAIAIDKFGVHETQITAFGCTSRAQAQRAGKWILYSEQNQTEVVTFKTGLTGAVCRPGEIIKVADKTRSGNRRAGRILEGHLNYVILDMILSENASDITLSIILKDGTIVKPAVSNITGNRVEFAIDFTSIPEANTIWMVESSQVEAQQFKIVGVNESAGGVYVVTAVAHEPSKYDFIEKDIKIDERSISILSETLLAPENISITETLYEVNGEVRVKVTGSWNSVVGATSYVARYSKDSGNEVLLPFSTSNDIEILNAEPGLYRITVYAQNSLGGKSNEASAEKNVIGKALPPGNIQGFSMIPSNGIAYLSWDKSSDLDVLIGGSVRIRFTPEIDNPVWKESNDVALLAGSATRAPVPLLSGTYMAKFVDASGNASINETKIITTIPEAIALNIVETITESPTFAGIKTDMEYVPTYEGLALKAAFTIDEILEDIDDVPNLDFAGGVAPEGYYEFANYCDLGEVYSARFTANILSEAVDVSDTIDQRIDEVDDWQDIDGDYLDDVNAELFLRTTLDDPSSPSAVWSEWKRFLTADYSARGIQFKLKATSAGKSHNIIIKGLSVTIDMPDRVIDLKDVVSGAGVYSVTYPQAFKNIPSVGITANNMASGDYFVISNKTDEGFDIVFKNSAGTNISRTFDALIRGYGRKLN